jgi:rare lipoprotein A
MKILAENSILNERAISTARRVVSIAVGATVGISLGLTNVQASQPGRALLASSNQLGRLELSSKTPVVVLPKDSAVPLPLPTHKYSWRQIGLASWYGQQFQGRTTANGVRFDMNELSCAHRTLPLGTWVRVTNLRNHKWVVLRVNDRGPVPETRIVDLSSAAAHLLGMHRQGIARVRLDVIDPQQAADAIWLEHLHTLHAATQAAQAQAQMEAANAAVGLAAPASPAISVALQPTDAPTR